MSIFESSGPIGLGILLTVRPSLDELSDEQLLRRLRTVKELVRPLLAGAVVDVDPATAIAATVDYEWQPIAKSPQAARSPPP
jgi:hypothetical protein